MSGHQWEVVGKKKDRGNKNNNHQKVENETKKKELAQNVKWDEILTKNQINNLFSHNSKSTEKKTQQDAPTKKPSVAKKSEAKPQEKPKPKPPKSIESALNLINPEDFKSLLGKCKTQFPDGPIVWLKELSQFLNQKLLLENHDPIFTNKPHNYPLSIVPNEIKSTILEAANDAKKSNLQLFFDITLSALATDMVKNAPCLGHKLFLQHIATNEPELIIANLQKHVDLRNSYQNRPNIGLSILWSVGQVGFTDLKSGLKVFQELMLPLIEMKNYSRYIVQYLIDIINANDLDKNQLTKEDHMLILDIIYTNRKNFPIDLKQNLYSIVPKINKNILPKKSKDNKLSAHVEFYMKKLLNSSNKSYQDGICDIIVECFIRDCNSLQDFSKIYTKNITSSAILFKYILSNWKSLGVKIDQRVLKVVLKDIETINSELALKKRKEEGLVDVIVSIQDILNTMASKKKSGSPFKLLFFVLTLFIGGFVFYDIRTEGSWQDSRTRKALKDSGICEHIHVVLDYTKQGLLWIDGHIEGTFPQYKTTLHDFSEPYIELAKDLGFVVYNLGCNIKDAIVGKIPIVVESVEKYAPGLVEQSQNILSNIWTTSVLYFNRSVDYLKKEVFVGQLSPENMQRVVIEALNTTQVKATEYYHWLYEKVQTTIK